MTFHFEFTVALMLPLGAVSDCAAFTVDPSLYCLHIHLFFSPMSDSYCSRAGVLPRPPLWLRFLPHRREWHDIYQSCKAGIHFFFLKWHGWKIHG